MEIKQKLKSITTLFIAACSFMILSPKDASSRDLPFKIILENKTDDRVSAWSGYGHDIFGAWQRFEAVYPMGLTPREILHITYGHRICEVNLEQAISEIIIVLEENACRAYHPPGIEDNGEVQVREILGAIRWRQ